MNPMIQVTYGVRVMMLSRIRRLCRSCTHHLAAGLVFRIPDDIAKEVWDYLDHREKDGYTRKIVDVYGKDADGNDFLVEKDASWYRRDRLPHRPR